MFPRFVAAALVCLALVACKETDGTPVGAQFVRGAGNVRVINAQLVPTGDASAATSGGTITYVVARIEFTNDTGLDVVPTVDHFYLLDQNNNRYQGKDSGSSVFTGVSNSVAVLKKDEKREYTVGFRTPNANTTGTISYER